MMCAEITHKETQRMTDMMMYANHTQTQRASDVTVYAEITHREHQTWQCMLITHKETQRASGVTVYAVITHNHRDHQAWPCMLSFFPLDQLTWPDFSRSEDLLFGGWICIEKYRSILGSGAQWEPYLPAPFLSSLVCPGQTKALAAGYPMSLEPAWGWIRQLCFTALPIDTGLYVIAQTGPLMKTHSLYLWSSYGILSLSNWIHRFLNTKIFIYIMNCAI